MKIVLVGYMGSGKTTVGKWLAQALKVPFIDLDAFIEETYNDKVSEIFAKKGVIFFRKAERKALEYIATHYKAYVLATGGGAPCYGDNMKFIKEMAQQTIYLKVRLATLAMRLEREKENRPLIAHLSKKALPEFLGKHLFERAIFYNQAGLVVDATDKDPAAVSKKIITYIKGVG